MFNFNPPPGFNPIFNAYAARQAMQCSRGIPQMQVKAYSLERQGRHEEAEALRRWIEHIEKRDILPKERAAAVLEVVTKVLAG
jgi:hypothetical protein